jgi:hypothetical protein
MWGIDWPFPSSGESVISVTSTRPAVLIDSIRAGARAWTELEKMHCDALNIILTSRRELQIKPMKLLSLAI